MIIEEITLFTSNIEKQRQFYKTKLGFEIVKDTPSKIAFKVGASILAFQYKKEIKPSHLAFNIPYNAIYDALRWLRDRTEVIHYKNEPVTDFIKWKAKAVYFYDADHNIIEFIARERIDIESDIAFTPRIIIGISEIAIATTSIETIYNTINAIKPISIFDGSFDRFCALGNEQGLFIIIDKTKKKWYPTMDKAYTADFIIKGDYNFAFVNGEIKEIS